MQSITVIFIQDASQITNAVPCSGADFSLCNTIESAYDSGAYSFGLLEFQDIPAWDPAVTPLVDAWGLSHFPAVAFMNTNDQMVFYVLDGNKVTKSRAKAVFDVAEEFTYSEGIGGFVNGEGQQIDFEAEVKKKTSLGGGLSGSELGFSWGINWGNCSDYLPASLCKGSTWFFIVLIILLLALVAYKFIKG